MVCPSRKNLMIKKIMHDKRARKTKNKMEEKEITEEEHQERLQKLKEIGLIK